MIALGFASGVFASFTPFIGFHFFIGFMLAWVLGGNIIASALGTFIGNPITFPFIWWITLITGNRILGHDPVDFDWDWVRLFSDSSSNIWLVVKPMLVAGVPMGIIVATLSYFLLRPAVYFLLRPAVNSYQVRRRKKRQHLTGPDLYH